MKKMIKIKKPEEEKLKNLIKKNNIKRFLDIANIAKERSLVLKEY